MSWQARGEMAMKTGTARLYFNFEPPHKICYVAGMARKPATIPIQRTVSTMSSARLLRWRSCWCANCRLTARLPFSARREQGNPHDRTIGVLACSPFCRSALRRICCRGFSPRSHATAGFLGYLRERLRWCCWTVLLCLADRLLHSPVALTAERLAHEHLRQLRRRLARYLTYVASRNMITASPCRRWARRLFTRAGLISCCSDQFSTGNWIAP